MEAPQLLYRVFDVQCTRQHLIELGDWLNSRLSFALGEDFNKLSEEPLGELGSKECDGGVHDADLQRLACETDRKVFAGACVWAADIIETLEGQPGVRKNEAYNKARQLRRIAKKIYGESEGRLTNKPKRQNNNTNFAA